METAREKLYRILQKHVPENAVHYCLDLWIKEPFHFRVTRKRQSKLGDYRHDRRSGEHTISLNHNLNPYSFLITFIHEFAHLITTSKKGIKATPHGKTWKSNFQTLMAPLLNDLVFPPEVLHPLKRHMRNPKASSQSDAALVAALRSFDDNPGDEVMLDTLDTGDIFEFHGHVYRKLNKRRTRIICEHAHNGRKYLITKIALVKVIKGEISENHG